MGTTGTVAETSGFDRDYWLTHCQGFRVNGEAGWIGVVEDVLDERGQSLLAIRAGLLGRRLWLIPSTDVEFIVPRAQRIWLRTPIHVTAHSGSGSGATL